MLISRYNNINIEEHIKEFEKKYDFVIPTEYRAFLMKYNGGNTPDTQFKFNKVASDISGFYGLGDAEINYSNLEKIDVLKDSLLEGFLPIGQDSFGNFIFIGINENVRDCIYFIDHDLGKKYLKLTENVTLFVKVKK